MHYIVIKYESLVEDGQWDKKSEKYVKILSLTSYIQELNIIFAKKAAYQDRYKNNNIFNTMVNNDGSSWKTIAPTSGESWTK